MKHLFFIALTLFTLVFLQSCQKNQICPPKKYPIVGLWIGTYKIEQGTKGDVGTDNLYYSFDIRDDSTILTQGLGADGNTYYSVGTWSLHGKTFTATITAQNLEVAGTVQDVTADYDAKTGTLNSGVVKNVDPNYPFTASFVFKRTN
jgi:hypothetical protein